MAMSVEERLAILEAENRYQNEKLEHMSLKQNRMFERVDDIAQGVARLEEVKKVKEAETKAMRKGAIITAVATAGAAGLMAGRGIDWFIKLIETVPK